MLIKIVRELTPEEVRERIKGFEKDFGMNFERFEEAFFKKKLSGKLAKAYFEWAELVDSYRGYVEEGQLDYTTEEIREFKPEQAALLTPKRIELLYQLAVLRVDSINDFAQKVGRNVKNVYEDLKVLSKFGFVRFSKRKGKALVPETTIKEITFLIR
ncbi:MAG: hypothetical protein QXJ53_03100 [Candidatus Bathyarchaeia archaeon]